MNISFIHILYMNSLRIFKLKALLVKKVLVSHSIDTGGDLETIIIHQSGKKLYDTLEYHDTRENLANYLKITLI